MVKLTVTIATAVAAAAVLVEGSSDPGSPLSPHSQFFRDGRSGSSGLGPSDSDTDVPSPRDYDRELSPPPKDGKRGGKLRSGHRHPPLGTGSSNMPFDGSDADPRHGRGSGSFDGRFPPPPDAGNDEMPPFPDHRKDHRKDFGNGKPNKQDPSPPGPLGGRPIDPPPGDGHRLPDGSVVDSWDGSGSAEGRFRPPPDVGEELVEEGLKLLYDDGHELPPPIDSELMPPKRGDRRGKPLKPGKPDGNQRSQMSPRANEQPHGHDEGRGEPNGGKHGSGSFNGRFSPPPNAGSGSSPKHEHAPEAGTDPSDKPLPKEGSGSLFPMDGSRDSGIAPPMAKPQTSIGFDSLRRIG